MTKPASVRINKHQLRIMDLTFTDMYMGGKTMPCNFNS